MDAYAEFHFVVSDFKSGVSRRRNGATRECKTEGTNVFDNLVRNCFDFFEFFALFRRRARAFMYEDRARNSSATYGVEGVFDCDIVVDVHCVDFDAVVLCVCHCVVEVHTVTGVVLDDEKNAFVRCAFLDCVVDLNL